MPDRQNPNDPTYDWLYSGNREAPRGSSRGGDETQYVGQADDIARGGAPGGGETQMMGAVSDGRRQPSTWSQEPSAPQASEGPRDSFGGTYPAPPPRQGSSPQETSRFPAQGGHSGRGGYGGPPPPRGPHRPQGPQGPHGGQGPRGQKQRRPRRPGSRKRWVRLILALVVLYLVFLVVTPIIALNRIDRVQAEPSGSRPDDTPGTTYLLVGNSARKGAESNLADSILILHVTDSGDQNVMISIPRDSEVDIPGYGTNKINAATALPGKRAAGRKLLVKTVEQNTGIRIDDYIEVGFGTFPKLVDAVGGVEVCLKKGELVDSARSQLKQDGYVTDKLAHLKMEAGCQEVDGQGAFAYSRARHIFAYGDYARGKHQREVIGAVGDKILSPATFILPWRYWAINMESAKVLKIGENVGTWDLVKFARAITSQPKSCIMPMVSLSDNRWDETKVEALMSDIKDDNTDAISCSLV